MGDKIHDLAIVGCGPAGLSAAINARIRNTDMLLFGTEFCSPKLYKAENVDNYLGFHNITGEELRDKYLEHVKSMGISIKNSRVDSIYQQEDHYTLMTKDGTYSAYSLILAPGVSFTEFIDGEEDLIGGGVSYCATCDGALYRGKHVAVIAYNSEGIEDAEFLAEIAEKVYFIPQFDFEEKLNSSNIEIVKEKPLAIKGENTVDSIQLENKELKIDGVFIYREITPPDRLIFGIEIEGRHIKVNNDMETNLEGVYAAGDCTGIPYQLARAVGQGQIASLNAVSYVRKKKKGSNKNVKDN
ncbi:MAG: NAD(P)/FAD-dependent oxidoreductase [Halanaerobiales bacterium]